jgi:hypothetical protein
MIGMGRRMVMLHDDDANDVDDTVRVNNEQLMKVTKQKLIKGSSELDPSFMKKRYIYYNITFNAIWMAVRIRRWMLLVLPRGTI